MIGHLFNNGVIRVEIKEDPKGDEYKLQKYTRETQTQVSGKEVKTHQGLQC
jgi:hypothetical protein